MEMTIAGGHVLILETDYGTHPLNPQNSDRPPAVQFYLSPDSRSVTQGRG
jgi:hypothetical protein